MKTACFEIMTLLLLLQINSFAGWQNVGNCTRINAHDSNIIKFVLDQNNKYIFTIDVNKTLKKWDFETGENIWSKQILPDINENGYSHSTFLSSDAKTYLNFSIVNSNDRQYSFIHDIENDKIIDSLFFVSDFGLAGYCFKFPDSFFGDYITDAKKIITYFNTEEHCQGPYTANYYTGWLTTDLKADKDKIITGHLNLKFTISKLLADESFKLIYYQGTENNNYYKNNYLSSDNYGLTNGIILMDAKKINKISDYSYSSVASYPNPPNIAEKGSKMPFISAFFDVIDSNIYLLLGNSLFKFDIYNCWLQKMYDLHYYSPTENLNIYKTDNELWFQIIKDDSLLIHLISNNYLGGRIKLDSINKIQLYQNSKDNKYLILTDSLGNLYKLNYSDIFNVVSVNDKTHKNFHLYPNPATDFIEISGLNKGLNPLVIEDGIRIYNMLGECVNKIPLNPPFPQGEITIDVSGLPAGVYFVRVGNQTALFVKKKL